MKASELSLRYAKAIYMQAAEDGTQEQILTELRAISESLARDRQTQDFFMSPVVDRQSKVDVLKAALSSSGASDLSTHFALLLAERGRLNLFLEVVEAYQLIADEEHGVTRGTVYSAGGLGPQDRELIQSQVEKVTKKKVILTYKEDSRLIGGLVAQVGSYTFDDSLTSHLRRLKEELNRRAH